MILSKSKFKWSLFPKYLLALSFGIWVFNFGINNFLENKKEIMWDGLFSGDFIGRIIAFILIAAWIIYVVYFLLTQIVRIIISTEGINFKSFGNYFIKWEDIDAIEITGRKGILMLKYESVTIKTKDDNFYQIIVEHFSNEDKIRFYLQHFKELKNANENYIESLFLQSQPKTVEKNFLHNQVLKKYGTSSFLCYLGIVFWIVEIFFGAIFILAASNDKTSIVSLTVLFAIILFFYFFIGNLMYYFQASDKVLTIRNHFFFWVKRSYYVDDIYEIAIEDTQYRDVTALRVISRQFQSRLYHAASVWDKQFGQLQEALKAYNVQLRVE